MKPRTPASRQRGVALIIALVLMALATILAVKIGFGGFVERKRTTSMLAAEQAYQFAMGAEALAADVLNQNTGGNVNLAQPWAQAPQPIPLRPPNDPEGEPLGTLEGSLEDMSGRFNINNLLRVDSNGKPDPQPLEQFERILESLNIETKWAELARDWIDPDNNPSFPNGAEDSVYLSQTPPYRTANWPMLSTSELLSLPGFGAERYQKLAPYITALPISDAKINVCTASGRVLDSLTPGVQNYADEEALAKARKNGCFPGLQGFTSSLPPAQATALSALIYEKTDYFRLTTIVTLGSTEFTLYSLLWLSPNTKKVTPILRSFGTP